MREIPVLYKRKEECCGCTACYAICPKEAISMVEDQQVLSIQNLQGDLRNYGQQLSDCKADYQS